MKKITGRGVKYSPKWHEENIAGSLRRLGLKLSHDIHGKIQFKSKYGAHALYSA